MGCVGAYLALPFSIGSTSLLLEVVSSAALVLVHLVQLVVVLQGGAVIVEDYLFFGTSKGLIHLLLLHLVRCTLELPLAAHCQPLLVWLATLTISFVLLRLHL